MKRILFGAFAFERKARQVTRKGAKVHLTPKAFDLLEMLILSRPSAVSKRDIMDHLWPDCFVTEGGVANLVSEIREALEADGIPHVRTIHGFGYAFCSDAAEAPLTPERAGKPPCRLVEGGPEPRSVGVFEGDTVIGRSWDCDVRIPTSSVSRQHARIRLVKEVATLEDLGSRNGTRVNGRKVKEPTVLQDSDQIEIGAVELVFRVAALSEKPTDALPPRRRRSE